MRIKNLIFTICAIAFANTIFATADSYYNCNAYPKLYARANLAFPVYIHKDGHELNKPKFKIFGTIAYGNTLTKDYSVEFEAFLWKQDTKVEEPSNTHASDLESYGALINAIAHPNRFKFGHFQPFIGVGIGSAQSKTSDYTNTYTHKGLMVNNIIYQAIIGSEYYINKHFNVTADVRWLYPIKFSHQDEFNKSKVSGKLSNTVLTIGSKINF